MRPSGGGDIPEFLPPKHRQGSAVKRAPPKVTITIPPELASLQEVNEWLKRQLQQAATEAAYYRKELSHCLYERNECSDELLKEQRKHQDFVRDIKVEFKAQLAEREKKIRADLQKELDEIVTNERIDTNRRIDEWEKYSETLRDAVSSWRTRYNELVYAYEELRRQVPLLDVTNFQRNDEDNENRPDWMDLGAIFVGAKVEQNDEKE